MITRLIKSFLFQFLISNSVSTAVLERTHYISLKVLTDSVLSAVNNQVYPVKSVLCLLSDFVKTLLYQ